MKTPLLILAFLCCAGLLLGQANLPLSRTTWTGSPPTGWTDNGTSAYTTTFACTNSNMGQLNDTGDSYLVNFNTIPDQLIFKLKEASMSGNTFVEVEESPDNSSWTTLGIYGTCGSCTPISDCADISISLNSSSRYVRWTYTKSVGNCGLDDVSISEGTLCTITDIAVSNAGSCNDNGTPADNSDDYYEADVTITYNDAPVTGSLDLVGAGVVGGNTSDPISSSPQTLTGVRLSANGSDVEITALFSDETICTYTETVVGSSVASCSPGCSHTLSSFVPTSGPEGTIVTLTGSGFTGSTTVAFDGLASTSVSFVNATTLTAEVPVGASTGAITVTENNCDIFSATGFVVLDSANCGGASNFSDLIISEVYDSESNNVWNMELYNPTGSAITLDGVYEIQRDADDGGGARERTIALTGSVPANDVFTLRLGTSFNPCSTITYDYVQNGGGINADDAIYLVKNSTDVDKVVGPSNDGYTIKRNGNATGPTPVYNAADWTEVEPEECTDLGVAPVTSVAAPTVSAISDNSSCGLLDFSVTAMASNGGTLSYQWFYNDGNSATWTAVTSSDPPGFTILGETSDNLLIEGDANPLSDLEDYLFYVQVSESPNGCDKFSNAVAFTEPGPEPFFRTVGSGNWNALSTWEMDDNVGFSSPVAACKVPNDSNSDYIEIMAGDSVSITDSTLNPDVSADQIIVNGILHVIDESAEFDIVDGTGTDLVINGSGTLIDNSNSGAGNGPEFATGATWSIASGGTLIKTNTGSAITYRNNYEGGISSIPADANWIYRYLGANNVTIASSASGNAMFYPNLTFESISGAYDFSDFDEIFTGRLEAITIKGDFTVGSSSANPVTVINNNFNAQPLLVQGDFYIEAGSELTNQTYRSFGSLAETGNYNVQYREGAGIELQGDAAIFGTLDLNHAASVTASSAIAPGDEGIIFSKSGSLQAIIGDAADAFLTNDASVNTVSHVELTDIIMQVFDNLSFTTGRLIARTDGSGDSEEVHLQTTASDAISGAGTNSYVDGNLRWNMSTGSSYQFEIGQDGSSCGYAPFSLEFTGASAPGNIIAFFDESQRISTNTDVYGCPAINTGYQYNCASGAWDVSPDAGSSFDYTITLTDCTPCGSGPYKVVKDNVINDGCPTGLDSSLTAFSKFDLLAATQILAVEFLYFQAEKQGAHASLQWATVLEVDNAYFEVERSKDGQSWESIGRVRGAGNSQLQHQYSLMDYAPLTGFNYYRLKAVDVYGQFDYSEVQVLSFESDQIASAEFILIPTLTSGELTLISKKVWEKNAKAQVINMLGQPLLSLPISTGQSRHTLNVNVLPAGQYILRIEEQSIRFVKR